jgi:hypothetical protein
MERCNTCVWWGFKPEEERESYAKLPKHFMPCDHPKIVGPQDRDRIRLEDDENRDAATVNDASDYFGQFVTGPEFGCVLHEKKSEPNG